MRFAVLGVENVPDATEKPGSPLFATTEALTFMRHQTCGFELETSV
jgi:hypothetical protein